MTTDLKLKPRPPAKLTSLLGLALDGNRLEGVVLRRVNGSVTVQHRFTATLTLDPLTAAPELVGRELRNHLDAAGIRERHCLFGLPLKWVLTTRTEVPPLAPADAASLLQVEAERGFHYDLATLQVGDSRAALAGDRQAVLLAGVPVPQLAALQAVLAAARLKPVSFGLGITALQPPVTGPEGVMTLVLGERQVELLITAAGGVLALRSLEGGVDNSAGQVTVQAEVVARETRITYGQLPEELRSSIRRIRLFGPPALARSLADELELRFEPFGLSVEVVTGYAPNEFSVTLPPEVTPSAVFSLTARYLANPAPVFEFLPPKPNLLEIYAAKYASGRWRSAGLSVAAVVLLVLGLFLYQQIQLWHLRSQWSAMADRVGQLQTISTRIQNYRPWFGNRSWNSASFPYLSILRVLSLAFPEDGSVTAKSIEIRDAATVSCSGTATDVGALLAMEKRLAATPGVTAVHHEQSRGKSPLQFVLSFHFTPGAAQ